MWPFIQILELLIFTKDLSICYHGFFKYVWCHKFAIAATQITWTFEELESDIEFLKQISLNFSSEENQQVQSSSFIE